MAKAFFLSCCITAVLSFSFGLVIVRLNTAVTRAWAAYCLTVSLWSLGLGLLTSSSSQPTAEFWVRVHYLGAIFIPGSFLYFTSNLLGTEHENKWLLRIASIVTLVFLFINFSGQLVSARVKPPFNFYTAPGKYYNLYTIYFAATVLYSHVLLFRGCLIARGLRRTQIQYVLIAGGVAFLGGSTAFLPVYNVPIVPAGMYLVPLYIALMTYAILYHQLMDIRLILRDTTVNLVTAAILGGGILAISIPVTGVHRFVGSSLGVIGMGFAMAFAYDPVRRTIQPAIDRIMFSNRYGYLEELSQIPNDMLEFTNLREMLKFLVTRLTEAARLERVRILMYDPGHQSYIETLAHTAETLNGELEEASGPRDLPEKSRLIQLMSQNRRLLVEEDLVRLPVDGSTAFDELQSLGGVACFPVMKDKDVLGLVVLGKKRSGEPFNQQDLKILGALRTRLENFLAQAMTITQEALNMVKDSHDMKNDVNALKGRVTWRAMRIAAWKIEFEKQSAVIEKGFIQTAPEVQTAFTALKRQALEWFQEADRSRAVEDQSLQRLSHRLKNWAEYGRVVSEGFRGSRFMEAIDVGSAALISVERWKPHAERRGLELTAEVTPNIVVWGERSLVEQVIENLIDNALKATKLGKVGVCCRSDREGILIEVRDTGCGIPAEDLPTIFEKPFYQGKGRESLEQSTGVGLYLVSQYVRSLGGSVRAESEVGRGSSFIVHLPRYDQEHKGAAA